MRVLLLVSALLVAVAAEEEAPAKLPPAADAVLEKFARTEEKLTREHAQAVIAERTKAIDALGKILKDTTKTGDLDAANAVKARITALRAANAEQMPTDLLGNARSVEDPAKLFPGEWTLTKKNGISGTLTVTPDGAASIQVMQLGVTIGGRWEVLKDAATGAKRIRIVWGSPDHWEEIHTISADKAEGDSFDGGKGGLSLQRKRK